MKLKLVLTFISLLVFGFPYANAAKTMEANCLEQLTDSIQQYPLETENFDSSDFSSQAQTHSSSVDPLLMTYFDDKYIKTKKITQGTESNLNLKDIFNVYNLFDSGLTEQKIHSLELGTQSLETDQKNSFLYCYATTYTPLTEKKLDNLEKGDFAMVASPNVFEIKTVNNYKEVYIEKTIRDKNALDLFSKKSLFILPENPELEQLYNVHTLIEASLEAWTTFQEIAANLYAKSKAKESFEKIFEDENAVIEISNQIPTGIKPIFINGSIFTHTYFAWNRHAVFMDMLFKEQQMLEKTISLANKIFPNNEEEELTWLEWIQFFRYEDELNLDKLEIKNYFKQPRNIARYEYFFIEANDKDYSREQIKQFQTYLETELANSPETFQKELKTKAEGGYQDFKQFLPIVQKPKKGIKIEQAEFFTYEIPGGYQKYLVTLEDGSPLPEWLSVDTDNLILSGTGTNITKASLQIWGQNEDDRFLLDSFEIEVVEKLSTPLEDETNAQDEDQELMEKQTNNLSSSDEKEEKIENLAKQNLLKTGLLILMVGLIILLFSLLLKKLKS